MLSEYGNKIYGKLKMDGNFTGSNIMSCFLLDLCWIVSFVSNAQLISVVCRHSMAHITSVSKAGPPFCKYANTNLHSHR